MHDDPRASAPLGPFEGRLVTGYAVGRAQTFHRDRGCGAIRRSAARRVDRPLTGRLIADLCGSCSDVPDLATSDGALRSFLNALARPAPLTDVDHRVDDAAGEAGTTHESAVRVLADERGAADADHTAARRYRDALCSLWERPFEQLVTATRTVERYPWLADWAASRSADARRRLDRIAALLDDLTPPLARLGPAIPPPDTSMSDSVLDDPRLSTVGGADDRLAFLADLARLTSERMESDMDDLDGAATVDRAVARAFGRRRKGRDEAGAAAVDVHRRWMDDLRERVADDDSDERRRVVVTIPRAHLRPEPLGGWLVATILLHLEAVDGGRSVLLRVPPVVARRLLARYPFLEPSVVDDADDDGAEVLRRHRRRRSTSLVDVLDDRPVAERDALTADTVDELRERFGGNAPFLVMSLSGVEVLRVDDMARRIGTGWTGVVLMRQRDLPRSLARAHLTHTSGEPVPARRPPIDAEGAGAWLAASLRHPSVFTPMVGGPDRQIAAYITALSTPDLRTLAALGFDDGMCHDVWSALLSTERLDTAPYESRRGAPLVPLGPVASVQVYTRRGDDGRRHGIACPTRRGRTLSATADLIGVTDVIAIDDREWCDDCSGYSHRRLTGPQHRYHGAAVELARCAAVADRLRDRPAVVDRADLRSDLRRLRDGLSAETDRDSGGAMGAVLDRLERQTA